MLKYRVPALSLILVLTFAYVFAQTADNKNEERQKQQTVLLEQIGKDADGLRLPENRALVFAKLGEGSWSADEKRARQFFQTSVNELIAAQTDAEAEKKQQQGNLYGLLYGTTPRQEILLMIAARDAEFALDAFYKSRPPRIAQALVPNSAESKKDDLRQYAQNEINFEQGLINKLSEQSPNRALELFRKSLARGVTYEAFNLIEKLKAKDLELAAQMANEVGGKLLAADFEKDSQTNSLAASFVGEYGKKPEPNQKTVKVDEKILRDLTAKIVKNFLKSEDGGYEVEYILPIAEKYAPESVATLKQKKAKYDKENKREDYDAFSKLMEGNPTPEKLLSEAEKFSDEFKNQIYYAAAEKAATGGNVEQARKIIASKLPENESENYLTQINYNLISQAMTAEKYDEAALLINQIPAETQRFYFLLQLATTVYQKNPAENKKQALSVVEQARALIPQPPETLEDMSLMMQIAATVAEFEPEQSFQILESLTYQLNEFLEASAVVAKYRNDGSLRKGEMVVNSYGAVNGLNNMAQILATLKKKDFGRTTTLINSFQRLEVRVGLAILLIDNPATDTPNTIANGNVSVANTAVNR